MHEKRAVTPNEEQRRAIESPRGATLNVLAGAGTGKTSVLVERYLKLVRDDGIAPERILALTFTLKAAAEMRHRVHSAIRAVLPEVAPHLHGAWIMNFHQFGFRLIKENAPALGIDPDVDVVSVAEFQRIRALLSRRFEAGEIPGVPADFGGEIPPPRKIDDNFRVFFDVVSKVRGDMVDVAVLRERVRDDDQPGYRAWVDAIVALAHAYEGELRRRNLIDFSDMITIPARGLLENESLRRRYSGRFDHILVDEFQDTSEAQNHLLRVLSGGDFEGVTVVGDDKQSIYRWRDARVENIREFPGAPEALRRNYRSRQEILTLAHRFICLDEDFAARADEIRLEADRGPARYPIILFHPQSDAREDRDAEAEGLALWVLSITTGDGPGDMPAPVAADRPGFEDVAVLLRSLNERNGRPQIERAFERHGIPYALIGGANAAETRALELLHAWLSILLPDCDVRELLAVLEREPFLVPDAVLFELFENVKRNRGRDWLAPGEVSRVGDETLRGRLETLRGLREQMRAWWSELGFHEFIDRVVEESPALLLLAREGVAPRAIDDVLREVHELARVLGDHGQLSLPVFLEHLRVAVDEKRFREEGDIRFPRGRVRVMTMHQAKGLEFPAVAVAGIKKPRSNTDRFFISRETGVYFSARDKGHWQRGYDDTEEKEREDRMTAQEARCLLYVAMTRARDFLWVSSAIPEGRKTLFADVLSCAAGMDGVRVLRGPFESAPAAGDVVDRPAQEREDLAATLEARRRARAAVERGERAVSGEPPPVTWRALEAFAACPLQYRYGYLTGLRVEPAADAEAEHVRSGVADDRIDPASIPAGVDPAQFGRFVHEALRVAATRPDAPAPDITSPLLARFDFPPRRHAALEEAAAALVDAFRSSELARVGEDAGFEEPFQVRPRSAVFHGIFDRIERTPEGWRVVDYKVGVPDDVHARQVAFYAWALERIVGAPVVGDVAYIRASGVDARRVADRAEVEGVARTVASFEEAAGAGEFTATPGEACRSCPSRGVCPSALLDAADDQR